MKDEQMLKRIIQNTDNPKPKHLNGSVEDTIAIYKFAYREVLLYNGYTEEQANTVEQLVDDMIAFLDGGENCE